MIWKADRPMIRYVTKNDEGQILSLMELVKDDFVGYKEKEFLEEIHSAISNNEAIMEKNIVTLLF